MIHRKIEAMVGYPAICKTLMAVIVCGLID